jgi:hypothetical protein
VGVALAVRTIPFVVAFTVLSWGPLATPSGAQPSNAAPPSISGVPRLGGTLTEVPGNWSGSAATIAVEWEDCSSALALGCAAIPGSPTTPGSQYKPTAADLGKWITVMETGVDAQGDVSQVWAYPVGPITLGAVTATMQWTFYYTPQYTKVLALLINGLGSGMTVAVGCRGHGCPFAKRSAAVAAGQQCQHGKKTKCTPQGTLNLAPGFLGRRLIVGARISVEITSPGGIGKYYGFTIRARQGPMIDISCLAPGATVPGRNCQAP